MTNHCHHCGTHLADETVYRVQCGGIVDGDFSTLGAGASATSKFCRECWNEKVDKEEALSESYHPRTVPDDDHLTTHQFINGGKGNVD